MHGAGYRMLNADCYNCDVNRSNCRNPFRTVRAAFTLVELLVVITIMGVITSIILFALAGAQESAKADKTRSTISKLNSLVMAKYESYRTRRVPITVPPGIPTLTAAQSRVDALRELMRMEMPDRYSDIQDAPVVLPARPSANASYLSVLPAAPNFKSEGAKCLYLLVSRGLDDPDVMSQFAEDEIATDSIDGMRYFVDGWGEPIFFVRWAPGFSSPLQPWNYNTVDALNNPMVQVPATSHDPFDPLKVYRPTSGDPFYNPNVPVSAQVYPPLYPLIFSGGPDKITDIYLNGIQGGNEYHYSQSSPPNNPYVLVNSGLFGSPTDLSSIFTPSGVTTGDGVDNSIDNITNHDLLETQ